MMMSKIIYVRPFL